MTLFVPMNAPFFTAVAAMLAFAAVSSPLSAQAAGKTVAKAGDWVVRKFPKYCVATVGFEGDRGLRLYSGADSFSFGFMVPGAGSAPAKLQVTYWFDNNKQAKQVRTAVKRSNINEDGGANWLIFVDKPDEPSHAGDFELAKKVTFTYKADGAQQTETFVLKNAGTAYGKLFQCSGR